VYRVRDDRDTDLPAAGPPGRAEAGRVRGRRSILVIGLRGVRDASEDRRVERVDIPLVGGPLDGRDIDVEVDDDGLPPEYLPEAWLWFAYGSELLDHDLAGRYELEPVAGSGPPWLYMWIEHRTRLRGT
jgi:hypothetical protein